MSFGYVKNAEGSFSIISVEDDDDDAPIISGSPEHSSLPRPLPSSSKTTTTTTIPIAIPSASVTTSTPAKASPLQFVSVLKSTPTIVRQNILKPRLVPVASKPIVNEATNKKAKNEKAKKTDKSKQITRTSRKSDRIMLKKVHAQLQMLRQKKGQKPSGAMTAVERSKKYRERIKRLDDRLDTSEELHKRTEKLLAKQAEQAERVKQIQIAQRINKVLEAQQMELAQQAKPSTSNHNQNVVQQDQEASKEIAPVCEVPVKKQTSLQNQLLSAGKKGKVLIRAPQGTPTVTVAKDQLGAGKKREVLIRPQGTPTITVAEDQLGAGKKREVLIRPQGTPAVTIAGDQLGAGKKHEVLIRAPQGTPMVTVAEEVIKKLEQRGGFGNLYPKILPTVPIERDPLAMDVEITPENSTPLNVTPPVQVYGSAPGKRARTIQRTRVQVTRIGTQVSVSTTKGIPVQVSEMLPGVSVQAAQKTPTDTSNTSKGDATSKPRQEKAPNRRVCLRWNSYHSNMQHSFPSLLDSEEFVDVTLACEGRSLKCHKMILSSCSDYLAQLLRENPCQHPIILMKDLKFWEVEALVRFMYRGEVNVTHDKLPQLLNAAEALQVKGLAGPSNAPPKPPQLVPQSRNITPQPAPSRPTPTASKEVPPSSLGGQSILKRGQKRPISTSDVPDARPLMKIRLQRPVSPQASSEPVVKTEPIDPPLSPGDTIYHHRLVPDHADEDEDSLGPSNVENSLALYEDDDPGGNTTELANASEQDQDEMKDSFNDDHMEVVPTDFLDQVQNIDEGPSDRNSSIVAQSSEPISKLSTSNEVAKDEEPRKQTQQRQSTPPRQRQSTSPQQKEQQQQKQQKEQEPEIEPSNHNADKRIMQTPTRRRRRGLGVRGGRGGRRKLTNGNIIFSPNSIEEVPDEDLDQSFQELMDESVDENHISEETTNDDVPITDLSSDTQSPFEGFTIEDIERAVRFIREDENDCERSGEENDSD